MGGSRAVLLFSALSLLVPAARAAKDVSPAAKEGEHIEFKTDDGWTLVGEFWRPLPEKGLTFILLHQAGGDRKKWEPLRKALFAHGYGVFEYDARGHGDSTIGPLGPSSTYRAFKREGQDNEWNQMSLDMDAALRELNTRGVTVSSIGIIGSALGANVGLKWAAVHHEVQMCVLISPSVNHHDVLAVGAMRAYGPRPVLIVAGGDDRSLLLSAKVLYDNAKFHSGDPYAQFWIEDKGQGIALLNPELVHRIVQWVSTPPKAPECSTCTVHESTPTTGELPPGPPPEPIEGVR
jgi:hypothetical protein